MESPVQDVTADATFDLLRDPYPLFAQKRRESGVFNGSVMDWSKTPDSMLPEHLYAAVSFDAVNRVFRDGKVFNSHIYDSTIGLFIGPTILAMEGKSIGNTAISCPPRSSRSHCCGGSRRSSAPSSMH